MRNVVYAINVSIDGYCDHDYFMPDEEMMAYFTRLIRDAGLLLYGRVTYELMVPYWPDVARDQSGTDEENEFATALSNTDKIVFSRTLKHVAANTQLLNGHLEQEVRILKSQPGKDISVGGVNLASQLMSLGLIDVFHFVVHPIIAGKGRKLMEGLNSPELHKLKLVASTTFKSGAVAMHYIK